MTNAEHRKQTVNREDATIPLALTLAFLLCFVLLVFLFFWKGEKLVALGLAGHFYYVTLLPMGLLAAATLFSGQHAYARLHGEIGKYKVSLGGPVAVFFLVPILGAVLLPKANLTMTIFVYGSGGKQDLPLRSTGSVWLDTGGIRRPAAIDMNGEAFFPEVSPTFRGQESPVGLDASGYELANPNQTVRLNPGAVYIEVRRKDGSISGHVQKEDGSPVSGANISVAGINKLTESDGSFAVTIPGKQMEPDLRLQATAEGYDTWTSKVTPDSNDVVITLVHKQ